MAGVPHQDAAPHTRVLVIDDETALARGLARMLTARGFTVKTADNGAQALAALEEEPDVVLLDLVLPDIGGMDILRRVKADHPDTEVVMMTAYADIDTAVEATKVGAFHFLTKPFASEDAVGNVVVKAAERRRLVSQTRNLQEALEGLEGGELALIGSSPAMQRVLGFVRTVAHSSSTVLVEGESGTGKELVARAVHRLGPRKHGAFVPLNCSAIPEHLIESEMFGHVRGAFTGAATTRRGLFEAASGGTLFLDEVADLPSLAQVKLLRALQEGEIRRVGSDETHHVDVRVISATNKDLRKEMEAGRFREDLYYRLNVINIAIPPLRERQGDVELLAHHFLRKYGDRAGKRVDGFSAEALRVLQGYGWPGNVRELENAIERAVVLATDAVLWPDDLPPAVAAAEASPPLAPSQPDEIASLPFKDAKERAVLDFERRYVEALLRRTDGNVSEAARRAGLDRSNFRRIVKRCRSDER